LLAWVQELGNDYEEAAESVNPQARLNAIDLAHHTLEIAEQTSTLSPYVGRLQKLVADIENRAEPLVVQRECDALAEVLLREHQIPQGPSVLPDLRRGEKVFATACAACHGLDGRAHTPPATWQRPPPTDFTRSDEVNPLSPFRVFTAVTFGVPATAMPSFDALDPAERWAVAFYIFTLRQPRCDTPMRLPSPEALGAATDNALTAEYGPFKLSCLRRYR
jgi:high-affinity iron transporter